MSGPGCAREKLHQGDDELLSMRGQLLWCPWTMQVCVWLNEGAMQGIPEEQWSSMRLIQLLNADINIIQSN